MTNELSTVLNNNIITEPGDNLSLRVTPTGRKVLKIEKSDGRKASAVQYPKGKTVYTFSS